MQVFQARSIREQLGIRRFSSLSRPQHPRANDFLESVGFRGCSTCSLRSRRVHIAGRRRELLLAGGLAEAQLVIRVVRSDVLPSFLFCFSFLLCPAYIRSRIRVHKSCWRQRFFFCFGLCFFMDFFPSSSCISLSQGFPQENVVLPCRNMLQNKYALNLANFGVDAAEHRLNVLKIVALLIHAGTVEESQILRQRSLRRRCLDS